MIRDNLKEIKLLGLFIGVFLIFYYLPVESLKFQLAVIEAFRLVKWYAREHVLLCLIPAFFIAGAIGVFITQSKVMKYFGAGVPKLISYSIASISGTILTVCSCTVLPMFGGIYLRGAGLGPAIAFLYSGPAINVLAIILTMRVLGWKLGIARAVGAVLFSILVGLLMHLIFLKEEQRKVSIGNGNKNFYIEDEKEGMPIYQVVLFSFSLIGILIFANLNCICHETVYESLQMGKKIAVPLALWYLVFKAKWVITGIFGVLLSLCLWLFLKVRLIWIILVSIPVFIFIFIFPDNPLSAFIAGFVGLVGLGLFSNSKEMKRWCEQTWWFVKQIIPFLFIGVILTGFLLGGPENKEGGIIPSIYVKALVGKTPATLFSLFHLDPQNIPEWLRMIWPLWTNSFASIIGALMYFSTLTEVPILKGLIDSGMGQGPALSLLLAGPAVSLPSILVLNSIMGPKKTLSYIGLVIMMATVSGIIFDLIVS